MKPPSNPRMFPTTTGYKKRRRKFVSVRSVTRGATTLLPLPLPHLHLLATSNRNLPALLILVAPPLIGKKTFSYLKAAVAHLTMKGKIEKGFSSKVMLNDQDTTDIPLHN